MKRSFQKFLQCHIQRTPTYQFIQRNYSKSQNEIEETVEDALNDEFFEQITKEVMESKQTPPDFRPSNYKPLLYDDLKDPYMPSISRFADSELPAELEDLNVPFDPRIIFHFVWCPMTENLLTYVPYHSEKKLFDDVKTKHTLYTGEESGYYPVTESGILCLKPESIGFLDFARKVDDEE
mmetsp:Transcript_6185/g.8995  ORF Transcript_6185/g.8995 Transcript_6185/m.8995 type:complete len:180 (-) Transcript_6185:41-580(-)